jgi:hypothetical protein
MRRNAQRALVGCLRFNFPARPIYIDIDFDQLDCANKDLREALAHELAHAFDVIGFPGLQAFYANYISNSERSTGHSMHERDKPSEKYPYAVSDDVRVWVQGRERGLW